MNSVKSAPAFADEVRAKRLTFLLLLALVGGIMFLLNAHTPLMMDDYDYSFSWSTGKRLAGVKDIVESQAAHYRLWGGRSVTHFLAQLFLYLGKPVFNIANTLMYLVLLLEIYALARRPGQAWDWRLILVSHIVLFFAVAFFGVAFLWLDGACNYLWGTVIALAPLLIAKSEREGGFFDAGKKRGFLSLPLFFLAGWTNENTACGVLAVLFLLLLWDVFKHRKIRRWRIAACLAHALGVAVMLLAPGNFARAAGEASRTFVMEMLYRFAVVSYCLIRYAGIPLALAAVLLAAAARRKSIIRGEWLCVLCGAALLSAYAMVGSPQISDRSFTGVIVLVIAAALLLLGDLPEKNKARSVKGYALLAAVVVIGGYAALHDVKNHEAAWLEQIGRITQAAENGESVAEVESVLSDSRYTMSILLEEQPDMWPNSTLERYYGVRIVGR